MAKQKVQTRRQYTGEYKAETLKLAERVGIVAAAWQLGLRESRLYTWRARLDQTRGEAERQALQENVRLKRQVAECVFRARRSVVSPDAGHASSGMPVR